MSRIAKYPVMVPSGVEVTLSSEQLSAKGALGTLSQFLPASVKVEHANGRLQVTAADATMQAKAMSGTIRAMLASMVLGVTKGYEKKLSLVGVGYKAQVQGDKLNLSLGFSHPVVKLLPKGVKAETPTPTEIVLKGADKQLLGQVAAEVRAIRPPEPYKGKGVRYVDEKVVIKETKKK